MTHSTKTLTVKGVGTVKQSPDVFGISFKVTGHEWKYSDAMTLLNESVEELRNTLESQGLDKKLLKTTSFDIRSDSTYNNKTKKHKFNGYIATHRIKIEIPWDNEKANELLIAINESTIDPQFSIYFTVSDPEKLKEEMLKEAVKNAKEKAGIIAEAAGVKVLDILDINYSWGEILFERNYEDRSYAVCEESSSVMPDIEPDDIEKSDTVEIVWEIGD